MKFEIIYAEQVVKKDIPNLSSKEKEVIRKSIEEKLGKNPMFFGKPLRYSLKPLRVLRVGNFRVVFSLSATQIKVIAIKHRSSIYKSFKP